MFQTSAFDVLRINIWFASRYLSNAFECTTVRMNVDFAQSNNRVNIFLCSVVPAVGDDNGANDDDSAVDDDSDEEDDETGIWNSGFCGFTLSYWWCNFWFTQIHRIWDMNIHIWLFMIWWIVPITSNLSIRILSRQYFYCKIFEFIQQANDPKSQRPKCDLKIWKRG